MSVYVRSSDDGQILFNRILFAFAITIKVILKIIVYSPLIFLSWLITKQLLTANTDKIIWIGLMLMFSVAFYFIIYFLKGILIALKYNRNLFWIPLFICCVILTCVLPVWIVFEPIEKFFTAYAETNRQLLTWICALAFGFYVYSKYHFLTNIAPAKAFPYYQRGIIVTNHFLRFSNGFKAKKSQDFI
ncbi:MAG TPA: hypothetical protein VFW07_25125 [Parafilimonas sp.]|nr:hypothetical protein [Parafilimonas sp.]